MSVTDYVTYVLACIAIVIIPGPTVTVIIANSLRYGTRAGLMNVLGTQIGLIPVLLVVAIGVSAIIAQLSVVFDWIRLLGAAYLIWLGYKLWCSDGRIGKIDASVPLAQVADRRFFWQGVLVILSNPKALLFFGAFLPQFVAGNGSAFWQVIGLGVTFMVVGTLFDSLYALASGTAGGWMNRAHVRVLERVSGSVLIGGGLWLAFARRFDQA